VLKAMGRLSEALAAYDEATGAHVAVKDGNAA
jgi:hypothetical protein